MTDLKRPDLAGHYADVIDSLKHGRLIPFLGSGVNLLGRDTSKPWGPGGDSLPAGGELAWHLARVAEFPTAQGGCSWAICSAPPPAPDLLQAAEYLAVTKGELRLYDVLHDLFDREYRPSAVHTFLAALPAALASAGVKKPHQVIVTTNYDDLMERAFDALPNPEPYDLVFYDARERSPSRGKFLHRRPPPDGGMVVVEDPRDLILPIDQHSVVLKIHGAVARDQESSEDSYVITEDHYFDYPFYTEIPITIHQQFQTRQFLFLGYSLSDWNLWMIFRRTWKEQKLETYSWTVNFKDDPVQRLFWEKRKVHYIVADLRDYFHDLTLQLLPSP